MGDSTFQYRDFYKCFSDLKSSIRIPETLKEYAIELYKHQKIPLKRIQTFPTESSWKGDDIPKLQSRNVLLFLSGGMDSAASMLWAIHNDYNVFPVFVRNLNTMSKKEEEAAEAICKRFNICTLTVINHDAEIKNLNSGFQNHNLKENPAKNQYIWFMCLNLMVKYQCEIVMFGNEVEFQGEYFSDMYSSFTLFMPFVKSCLNTDVTLITAFSDKKDGLKYIFDYDPKLFSLTHSCYMPLRFFALHNRQTASPPNICGRCFKCIRILKLSNELNIDLCT